MNNLNVNEDLPIGEAFDAEIRRIGLQPNVNGEVSRLDELSKHATFFRDTWQACVSLLDNENLTREEYMRVYNTMRKFLDRDNMFLTLNNSERIDFENTIMKCKLSDEMGRQVAIYILKEQIKKENDLINNAGEQLIATREVDSIIYQ